MTNFTMLVKNRPQLTKQAIRSIGFTSEMNITVLADGADDQTIELLEKLQREVPFLLIRRNESQGTGSARNAVIKASMECFGRGDHLYLSDNDVLFLYPWWMQKLVKTYDKSKAHGFMVIGAYNHPYHQPIGKYDISKECPFVAEVQALALQSMLMSWDVWDHYGPFNETPYGRVCMGEDVEFGNKIKADGGKLGVVSPAMLVNCGITNSFGEHIPGWEMVKAQAPSGVYVE